MALAKARVTSQSAMPAMGGITWRTRLMRRSALVKVPSFLQERGAGEEDMGIFRRLAQEQVLHHHAFHRAQAGGDVVGVGVGLGDILTLHIQRLERAIHCLIQHIGNAQARLGLLSVTPQRSLNTSRVASSDTCR